MSHLWSSRTQNTNLLKSVKVTQSGEQYFWKNSLLFLRVIKEVEMVGVPNKPSQISSNFRFIAAPVSARKRPEGKWGEISTKL